jgi:hypothetical protein
MHRSQRTRHAAIAGPTNRPPASSESHDRISSRVLLVTRDRILTDRLVKSFSDFAGDTLTIEAVDRVSDATRRLNQNDGVDAAMMDWDLPATRGFETLLLLMRAAPDLARSSRWTIAVLQHRYYAAHERPIDRQRRGRTTAARLRD